MYAYDALNRMDTVTEGGVVLADYDWDTLSRRDEVRLNAGAFKMDLLYEPDDDLASLVHTGPAPLTFDFIRNNSGQITILTASAGGFLSRPSAIQATGYVPNRLNQYASVAGTGFSHDANGNLSSDGTTGYEYDEENRLRSAVGGGFTTSYEYDPLGRRRAKTVNGVLTKFVSDNAEEVEERDGANTVLRRYVYGSGIDERIALLDAACTGGRCYYLTNWQGSTTTLVNQTGSTLNATYHYGPYGEGANWSPSDALTGNPFRYTGRRVDPETGLYYYRARYYSPKLGRFLQTDPIGTKDDLNLYVYAKIDPLNALDPTGRTCTPNDDKKGMTCKVDNKGPLTDKEVTRANKAYTAAVNRLLYHPNKTVTITVNGKSFEVKAGDLAKSLAKTIVSGGENSARASTIGGPLLPASASGGVETTINRNALETDRSGTTDNVDVDLRKTIIHEGLHGMPGEKVFKEQVNADPAQFNEDHQAEYNAKSSDLYDDETLDK